MNELIQLAKNIGITHYPGSSTKPGKLYHDIPFEGFSTHRKETKKRAELIQKQIDVKGKRGLDIGCSVGGISFYLQQAGAFMTGIDYDPAAIAFAQAVAKKYECPVNFMHEKVNKATFYHPWKFDFIVWLDNWMWIEKQNGYDYACDMLGIVSEISPILFFSTSQNDGQAKNRIMNSKDVFDLLKIETQYPNIKDLGSVDDGWHKRSIFLCRR